MVWSILLWDVARPIARTTTRRPAARTMRVMSRTRIAACAALPAPAKKFKTGAFSLRAHDVEHCVPTDFGAASGSCTTTWAYKVNFRRVTKHGAPHLGGPC